MRTNGLLILAFDHVFLGLLKGMEGIEHTIADVLPSHPDGLILNFGVLRRVRPILRDAGVTPILRLDGNRTYLAGDWTKSAEWEMFYTADSAAKAGAEAAIVNLLVGGPSELSSIKVVASAAAACQDVGIPLVVSAIALDSASSAGRRQRHKKLEACFVARLAYELGADIVNAYEVADPNIVRSIKEACPIPMIVSGISAQDDRKDPANWVAAVVGNGAAGICVGRAVWQSAEPLKAAQNLRSAMDALTVDPSSGAL